MPETDEQWREQLTEQQYRILREAGTEPAFSGEYVEHFEDGTYRCAGCGNVLFDSGKKYESGCGWPAFSDTKRGAVTTHVDLSHGMIRKEVRCAQCGGHLGHLFGDGPQPTGKRYCINSAALDFEPQE